MAQYWIAVNLTSGEYIDPSHLGDDMRLSHWAYPGTRTWALMDRLWSLRDDVVLAVGDESGYHQLGAHGRPLPGGAQLPAFDQIQDHVHDGAYRCVSIACCAYVTHYEYAHLLVADAYYRCQGCHCPSDPLRCAHVFTAALALGNADLALRADVEGA